MNLIRAVSFGQILLLFSAMISLRAEDHYVTPPGYGTNNPPYTNWADAATNIQWAVDVATNGETVWVTNGNYTLTNQVAITNGITLRGFHGRDYTFINGNYPNTTNRCFFVSNAFAVIDGLTISNGYSTENGGGVNLPMGTIRNSSFIKNKCAGGVGGYLYGGGGLWAYSVSTLVYNCIFSNNVASNALARVEGGAIVIAYGTVSNCVIMDNTVSSGVQADGGGLACNGTNANIYNCLIIRNRSSAYGGGIMYGNIQNCTVVSNYALSGGGVYSVNCTNSIVYFNAERNCNTNTTRAGNCCISPITNLASGSTNNIDADPLFVDYASGNYRLRSDSPCVNTGGNQPWMTGAGDLDGRQRIRYGRVDMGCYEMIYEGTMYRIGF